MSRITNLILTFSIVENHVQRMEEVNAFDACVLHLTSIDHDTNREERTKWYGGSKFWTGHAYFGAINYLPLNEFITHIKNISWSDPECVQLILRDEEEARYKIIDIFDHTHS